MIICDFETTGLIVNEFLPLDKQPHVIEIGLLKVNDRLEEIGRMSALVRPPIKIDDQIVEITGITNAMLEAADVFPFGWHVAEMAEFFLGEKKFVAHNAPFDLQMLTFELQRLGLANRFPFCFQVIDTRQLYSGKLQQWAREVKGEDFVQSHRALDDCLTLRDCYAYYQTVNEAYES